MPVLGTAEYEIRKGFTVTERVAIGRALEPEEEEAARNRQVEAGKDYGEGHPKEEVPDSGPEALTSGRRRSTTRARPQLELDTLVFGNFSSDDAKTPRKRWGAMQKVVKSPAGANGPRTG